MNVYMGPPVTPLKHPQMHPGKILNLFTIRQLQRGVVQLPVGGRHQRIVESSVRQWEVATGRFVGGDLQGRWFRRGG